jgi:predicted Zn-dependent peptidase
MNPDLHTLKNGLKVIFVDIKAFPTITTVLLVGAGSRYETENNNGIAHFFEHMAFKGSQKYPDSFVISSTIEGLGGIFNAFTSKDHTGYWIKSLGEHFETAIDVISDMVQHSRLLPEEIEREKGVITEEINMYHDIPQRKVGEMFEGLLYKGNPLGFDVAGQKEIISKFNRNTFVNYINSLYHPNNAVLVVAGGLKDKNSYLNLIKTKLENWKNGEKSSFIKIIENQTKPQIFIKHKKTEQAHFCLGFRAFSFNDERKYALNVLSAILGGGMSSRLFIQVRERRGLCYYISTGSELYADCGNIVTQAGVTNNLGKVKEAIETILSEHKKITKGDIVEDELKRAKELIKGRFLLSLEDSSIVANYFGTKQLLQNSLETPKEVIEKIEKVDAGEINELAKQLFIPESLNLALIGPFEDKNFRDLSI